MVPVSVLGSYMPVVTQRIHVPAHKDGASFETLDHKDVLRGVEQEKDKTERKDQRTRGLSSLMPNASVGLVLCARRIMKGKVKRCLGVTTRLGRKERFLLILLCSLMCRHTHHRKDTNDSTGSNGVSLGTQVCPFCPFRRLAAPL